MGTVAVTDRVSEILSWYRGSNNPGVLTNLAQILNHGRLGGTGRVVILPVDQGFEHGPGRSFESNPDGYDPRYHFKLAIAAGCSAHAAPLGSLELGAPEFIGQLPLILKLNNADSLYIGPDPCPALCASVDDALRLGCVGVGFTIYPGSAARNDQYEQVCGIIEEARRKGLVVVIWAYPRGSGIPEKPSETALDVVAYGAQIAAQLGAHLIKVKFPTSYIGLKAAEKVYHKRSPDFDDPVKRISHVVHSAFNGHRIVIFSGGEAKDDESMLAEVRAIRDGGGFGSIIGRNSFQRPWDEALGFLGRVMDIYAGVETPQPEPVAVGRVGSDT